LPFQFCPFAFLLLLSKVFEFFNEEFSELCGDKPPSVRWLNRVLGTQNISPKKKIIKSEPKESKIAESSKGNTTKIFDSLG
jgi:hypothetical protein